MVRFLIFFLFSTGLTAQITLSGTIADKSGNPISSASIIVQEMVTKDKLGFGISDSRGAFKIEVNSKSKSFEVRSTAFNFSSVTKEVSNKSTSIDFILEEKISEIEEVVFTKKMISVKGDTISFNAADFAHKSDKTLSDVLKNLPGVEVDIDGKIKFQGKSLSNFYVENRSLVGGAYGQITQALPKEDILKIEILENHQAIKVMNGKKFSDAPAMNIRLKKGVSLTGQSDIQSGFADPWLWNLKITPMFFSKKNQWLVNYKTNNTGDNLATDSKVLTDRNVLEAFTGEPDQLNLTDTEAVPVPSLPLSRYFFNNSHNISLNYLTEIAKDLELRIRSNYLNDQTLQSAEITTQYPNNIFISRKPIQRLNTDHANAEISLTKNTNQKYIQNVFSWNGYWDSKNTSGFRLSDQEQYVASNQMLKSPLQNFQNSFSAIVPVGQRLMNFNSYINLTDEEQNLDISPATYSYNDTFSLEKTGYLRQKVFNKNIDVQNSVFINYEKGKFNFQPKAGFNFKSKRFQSELLSGEGGDEISAGTDYINDNSWKNLTYYAELSGFYKKTNLQISADIPLQWNNIFFDDDIRMNRQKFSGTNFRPSIKVMYEFWNNYRVSGSGTYERYYGLNNSMFYGKVLSTPLSLISQNNSIPKISNVSITGSLQYRNTDRKTFITFDGSYNRENSSVIQKIDVTSQGSITEALDIENTSETVSSGIKIGKYFSKIRSNITFNYSYSNTNRKYFYDSLNNIKNENSSLSLTVNNTLLSCFNFNYTLNYHNDNITNKDTSDKISTNGLSQNLKLYFFVWSNLIFNINGESIATKIRHDRYQTYFLDAKLTYSIPENNIDFELGWMNIGDIRTFENVNISDEVLINRVRYTLRPSQILIGIKFKFK